MELVWPHMRYLEGIEHAFRQGWSPDNLRPEAAREALARLEADREEFVAGQVDREASGPDIVLPDGTLVTRLPGFILWMWDGEFCGSIGLRWQPGTNELPPYCLGHVGYSVVPWKRRRGYATRALGRLLPLARDEGLDYIELTTVEDNEPSRRVIEANGGVLIGPFRMLREHGGDVSLRYRIPLTPAGEALVARARRDAGSV